MAPFEPFETSPILAVAVSGGRDSLALALLSHDWAAGTRRPRDRADRRPWLACRIDRRGGGDGCSCWRATGSTSADPHLVRRQAAGGPAGGGADGALPAVARRMPPARHPAPAARPSRRDQVETVAMRAARQSGPDGLAGMAALVEQSEVRLLRPLLAVSRAELTATLVARGVPWLDDPSNVDPRFERARLRAKGCPASVGVGDGGVERSVRDGKLAEVAVDMLEFDRDGMAAIDRTGFARLGRDLQARLLSRLIQAVGGRDHPPRRERLERAARRLCAPVRSRKVRQGAGFHDFRLQADAPKGARNPSAVLDCPARTWQEHGPAPDSGCIFRLRRAGRFPSRMNLLSNGKAREPVQP